MFYTNKGVHLVSEPSLLQIENSAVLVRFLQINAVIWCLSCMVDAWMIVGVSRSGDLRSRRSSCNYRSWRGGCPGGSWYEQRISKIAVSVSSGW